MASAALDHDLKNSGNSAPGALQKLLLLVPAAATAVTNLAVFLMLYLLTYPPPYPPACVAVPGAFRGP